MSEAGGQGAQARGRSIVPLLMIPFLLSGTAALIAQLCWLRQLTVELGGSSAALNIILISFMGGLAGGARLARWLLPRTQRYLALYAGLEFGLSAYLLVSPLIIAAVSALFAQLLPALGHETLVGNLVRLVVAATALAPPTIAMGLTTPILITASVRELRQTGAHAGLLYGINTLGAALGCLLAGYWLINAFGVSSTIRIAAACNVAAAILALAFSKIVDRKGSVAVDPEGSVRGVVRDPSALRRFAWIAGIVGFTAMALEVVFARLMTFLVGSSYISQTISITGFLLGIVLGSLVVSAISRVKEPSEAALPFLLVAFGFGTVLSGLSFAGLPRFMQRHVVENPAIPLDALGIKLLAALALVVVPAMLSGMLLPYLIHLLTERERNVPEASSTVLFSNTLGSVLGVALTGYVLIESLGVMRTLFVLSLLAFLLAIFAVPKRSRLAAALAVAGLLAGATLAVVRGNTPLIKHAVVYERYGNPEILFYQEDESASVSVVTIPTTGGRRLLINGLSAADVQTDDYALGATTDIAMLSHPDPRSVYVAGIGSGKNAGVAGLYPEVEVDAVEISKGVIDALPLFDDYTYDLSTNPQVNVLLGDARHFLDATDRKYDVIIPDVFISALTGTAYLYNQEFFELCDRRLAPGGRVVMNVGLTSALDQVLSATFLSAFDHVVLVNPPYHSQSYAYLIGSNEPIEFPTRPWEAFGDRDDLMTRIEALGLDQANGIGDYLVAGDADLRRALEGEQLSTDDRPIIDFLHMRNRNEALVW